MPENPQGVPESMVFASFDGIKNTVDRDHLGPKELARAVNVDLDDVGQPRRRRGRTLVASGSYHSLFQSENGTIYGVKDGDLGIIEKDYAFTTLASGLAPERLDGNLPIFYEQIDTDVYFTSPYCAGIIDREGTVDDWGPAQDFWWSPVVDPSATLPAIKGKLFGGPPRASGLAYYNGRLYLSSGRMLWATILYLYTLVDKNRGFIQFENEITMVAAVSDGLYVGTTEGVWFLQGGSFETLRRVRVMDSPVIPGSQVYVPAELANPPQVGAGVDSPAQRSVAFMTPRGFCVGEDGGRCTNLTEGKMFFPGAISASAFWRRQDGVNQYIISLNSGGDPLNGARTGSYVDPAIKRGNALWVDLVETAAAREQYT